MRYSTTAALLSWASLATAHFKMNYPLARGFDEDQLGQFPCGSFDTPSENRTLWPISDGSIALEMGHISAEVEVLIGLGNDPGSSFNTVIRPTFTEIGLGTFCMTGLSVADLNITDGMNATIQVVTNGDPDGGLYNCADITFSSSAPAPAAGVCLNGTGVTATSNSVGSVVINIGNPNATTPTVSVGVPASTSTNTSTSAAVSGMPAGLVWLAVTGVAALHLVTVL